MTDKQTAMPYLMLITISFLLLILLQTLALVARASGDQFIFSGFAGTNLTVDGVVTVTSAGLLELTNGTLQPLISITYNLSSVITDTAYVGFSSATGSFNSRH
ncbi:hypothetical protein PR202_gb17148 [Eleusine coracana subsp. coracana]|uniref:Uncharacterized protein n=1 Tax=Eleusine coracana subsp. coracana TaxID=191504 RepID=A0AAV5F1N7_ELECO|nr:hypothetical protein PR202_gb17148 [Eleusine coracana subsp. coracana]